MWIARTAAGTHWRTSFLIVVFEICQGANVRPAHNVFDTVLYALPKS